MLEQDGYWGLLVTTLCLYLLSNSKPSKATSEDQPQALHGNMVNKPYCWRETQRHRAVLLSALGACVLAKVIQRNPFIFYVFLSFFI